jgi:hypothetical protein
MSIDGQNWTLTLLRSHDEINFIALANYVQRCRGTINSTVFGAKEMSDIIDTVLASYPLFSPESRRYVAEWISEYCRELINNK